MKKSTPSPGPPDKSLARKHAMASSHKAPKISVQPEQAVLEVLREYSLPVLRDYGHKERIQKIKEGLFARDFVGVFSNPDNLPAYAFRWVPSRALAYLSLFQSEKFLMRLLCNDLRITAVGAGAGSESTAIAALAALFQHSADLNAFFQANRKASSPKVHTITVNCVDFGPWGPILAGLAAVQAQQMHIHMESRPHATLCTTPASATSADVDTCKKKEDGDVQAGQSVAAGATAAEGNAASDATAPLHQTTPTTTTASPSSAGSAEGVTSSLAAHQTASIATDAPAAAPGKAPESSGAAVKVVHAHADVLSEDQKTRAALVKLYGSSHLVTACFVLNELFQDKQRAAVFVQGVIACMPRGSFLLIVDSAGDLSQLQIGSSKYHITVLLDALVGLKRVGGSDSFWYRLSQDLKFPLALENVHCYYRLYQRT
jgi:hypothetical protein